VSEKETALQSGTCYVRVMSVCQTLYSCLVTEIVHEFCISLSGFSIIGIRLVMQTLQHSAFCNKTLGELLFAVV